VIERIPRPASRGRQGGFSLAELAIAGTIGFMALSLGLMLYRTQSKMHLRQTDVNEAQLTVDYVVNAMRTMVISAGGGLPQMANGLRKAAGGKGIVTYVNPLNLVATVADGAYDDTSADNDGVIPLKDARPLVGYPLVMITHNEDFYLAKVQALDTVLKTLTLQQAWMEDTLDGVDFVYPVDYCSLYVDTAKNLIKTWVGKDTSFQNIPLAQGIDSLSLTFDLSPDGNAKDSSFTPNVADSNKVSRVKLSLRVRGLHTPLAGSTFRKYETIIGVRRGRLYNKAT
jgi:hypothetical protein